MIARLIAIQKQLNLTDLKFAERLGISRASWQAIRTGRVKPGAKSIPAILTAFPEMAPFISNASYLADRLINKDRENAGN